MNPATRTVALTVNGRPYEATVEARTLLSDLLRHELGLTGTHVGCEQGACGACTVIVDGKAVRSCLMLAPQADGAVVETVEGVASPEALHPVQAALHAEHGMQCGFCTAGIVMSLVASQRSGVPVEEATEEVLGGHICRCTGYVNIRAAIDAAWALAEEASS
ncbi:MAG: (2Fe-2S)-binding protein [Acidimicrobiales bacterium]|jgi:aerobic-type carbon monoxide dehydrogenase small subunit (CoxS/CutS family)|nr:(2Fe-2S)-binding protein [Acidimicrobiales bacterium]